MEEQTEKFGSGRKQKRQNNKKQRSNHKQQLKIITSSYKDLQEDIEDDWQEELDGKWASLIERG